MNSLVPTSNILLMGVKCPTCNENAQVEQWQPEKSPYKRVTRIVCEKGHCDVAIETFIDLEKCLPRSTVSLLFDSTDYVKRLKQMLGRSNTQHNCGLPHKTESVL